MKKNKSHLSRRALLVTAAAAATARTLPRLASSAPAKRVLTIVVDKATGAMRAIDRVVN